MCINPDVRTIAVIIDYTVITIICPAQFATDHCDVAQQQLMLHVATEIESQFNRSDTSLTKMNSVVNDELWVNKQSVVN